MTYSRPDLPYAGKPRKNNKRYENLTKDRRAPTAKMFDSEMNYVVDSLNSMEEDLKKVTAGKLTDSDKEANKDKILKTDGKGNISWVKVGSDEITDKGVLKKHMSTDSIGEEQIENEAITRGKIRKGALHKDHFDKSVVTRDAIDDGAVTNEKITGPIDGGKIRQHSLPANRIVVTTKHSYGVLGIHDGFGCEIVAGSAEGYFLRTEGKSGLTRYGRIKSEHLDKGIIETDHLGNAVVTADKIKSITPEQIYSDTHKDHYGVMVFSKGKAHLLNGPTDKGEFLRTKTNESGLPSFGRIAVDDLPKGSHPIYMAKWYNGNVTKFYDPSSVVTSLMPAAHNSLYMCLTFKKLLGKDLIINVTNYAPVQGNIFFVIEGPANTDKGFNLSAHEVAFLSTHGGSVTVCAS